MSENLEDLVQKGAAAENKRVWDRLSYEQQKSLKEIFSDGRWRCAWDTYGRCNALALKGSLYCKEHQGQKCASCGEPATHGCSYCGQFVCGAPLCDSCVGFEDMTRPSGNWGFMNHSHKKREG